MEDKKQFRKQALITRKNIELKKEKTNLIAEHLFCLDEYKNADRIYLYISYGSEAGTEEIINNCIENGKLMAAPRVCGEDMDFYAVRDRSELEPGAYGILEPISSCAKTSPAKKDIMLVPGCAFTRDGLRMGYGKGYYDRYLEKHPHVYTVGIAFEEQIYNSIPHDVWDKRLDCIITQRGIYR